MSNQKWVDEMMGKTKLPVPGEWIPYSDKRVHLMTVAALKDALNGVPDTTLVSFDGIYAVDTTVDVDEKLKWTLIGKANAERFFRDNHK